MRNQQQQKQFALCCKMTQNPRPKMIRKRRRESIDEDDDEDVSWSPPPKRMSMLMNTPKQRKDERRRLLRLSLTKLRDIDNAELCLHRAVVVHNTVRKLQQELKHDKYCSGGSGGRHQLCPATHSSVVAREAAMRDRDAYLYEADDSFVDHFAYMEPMEDHNHILEKVAIESVDAADCTTSDNATITDLSSSSPLVPSTAPTTSSDNTAPPQSGATDVTAPAPELMDISNSVTATPLLPPVTFQDTVATDFTYPPASFDLPSPVSSSSLLRELSPAVGMDAQPQCLLGQTGYFSVVSVTPAVSEPSASTTKCLNLSTKTDSTPDSHNDLVSPVALTSTDATESLNASTETGAIVGSDSTSAVSTAGAWLNNDEEHIDVVNDYDCQGVSPITTVAFPPLSPDLSVQSPSSSSSSDINVTIMHNDAPSDDHVAAAAITHSGDEHGIPHTSHIYTSHEPAVVAGHYPTYRSPSSSTQQPSLVYPTSYLSSLTTSPIMSTSVHPSSSSPSRSDDYDPAPLHTCSEAYQRGTGAYLSLLHHQGGATSSGGGSGGGSSLGDIVDPVVGALMHVL